MTRQVGRSQSLLVALVLTVASPAIAQEGGPPGRDLIRVFVDCAGVECDLDHLQREIRFVEYVRDRRDADIHLLITGEVTGAGGRRFDLLFIGRRDFESVDEELHLSTSATDTDAEVRDGLTRLVGIGLLRYVSRTPTVRDIRLSYAPGEGGRVPARPEDDPWKRWVFETKLSGSVSSEERTEYISLSADQSVARVTEGMKFALTVGGTYYESNFELSDSSTVTSITRSLEADALYVASLGNHWGLGFKANAAHSSFRNLRLAARFAPAVEFNIFPYEKSTRRQFRFMYAAGIRSFDYLEETVFFKTEERKFDHELTVTLDVNEAWGSADLAIKASQYLDAPEQNRVLLYGAIDLRLFRGLGLFLEGTATRVRDQFNLPRGEATDQQVLLRQRELLTDFFLEGRVGLSITFGSIFTDVVNPRFGS